MSSDTASSAPERLRDKILACIGVTIGFGVAVIFPERIWASNWRILILPASLAVTIFGMGLWGGLQSVHLLIVWLIATAVWAVFRTLETFVVVHLCVLMAIGCMCMVHFVKQHAPKKKTPGHAAPFEKKP